MTGTQVCAGTGGLICGGRGGGPREGRGLGVRIEGRRKESDIGQMSREVREAEWRGTSGDNKTRRVFHRLQRTRVNHPPKGGEQKRQTESRRGS